MASNGETTERILSGALRAIARRGPQKLSMSDVCDEARVSRGTLYRYFKNKDQVLRAVSEHVQDESRAAIERAVAADPAPERRLYVVLDTLIRYRETRPEAVDAIQAEPVFAIQWLRRVFLEHRAFLTATLEPAFSAAPAVQAGTVSQPALAELFLRVVVSTYLIPTADIDAIPSWLASLWDFLTAPADNGPAPAPDRPVTR